MDFFVKIVVIANYGIFNPNEILYHKASHVFLICRSMHIKQSFSVHPLETNKKSNINPLYSVHYLWLKSVHLK